MKWLPSWPRIPLEFGALVCLALTVLSGRQWVEGSEAMRRSDAAFDRGDLVVALSEARRAASAYAPGIAAVRRAHERMVAVATGCEETGDRALAVRAWRAVRASALDVRHLWSPFEGEIELAEDHLRRLERQPSAEERAGLSSMAIERGRSAGRSLDVAWALAVVAGLAVATIGLACAAWRGMSPGGHWRWNHAKWGLITAAVGLACWSLAVVRT